MSTRHMTNPMEMEKIPEEKPALHSLWHAPVTMIMTACLLLVGTAGCVNLTRESLPRRLYALNIMAPTKPERAVIPGTVLKVRAFQARPCYSGREFVYRRSDVRYETDYYNLFLVSPGDLLAEETGRWLDQRGPFERIIDTASRVRATHLLEGTVVLMEGDFRKRGSPSAALGISMTLINQTTRPPAIVFQKYYVQSAALSNTAPATLVKGWNQALQIMLTDFDRDLTPAVSTPVQRDQKTPRP